MAYCTTEDIRIFLGDENLEEDTILKFKTLVEGRASDLKQKFNVPDFALKEYCMLRVAGLVEMATLKGEETERAKTYLAEADKIIKDYVAMGGGESGGALTSPAGGSFITSDESEESLFPSFNEEWF